MLKFTTKDCAAIRQRSFLSGFANLPKSTRNKLIALIKSINQSTDFIAAFDEDRLACYREESKQ